MPSLAARLLALVIAVAAPAAAHAARVAELKVVDEQVLMVRVLDGEVALVEDVSKVRNRNGNIDSSSASLDVVTRYDPALDTTAAQVASNWIVRSTTDPAYGTSGKPVTAVHRRSKLNGMAVREWMQDKSDFRYDTTLEHGLFLRLPSPMIQGGAYTVEAAPATRLDRTRLDLAFDAFQSRSEAVHVNLAGYAAAPGIKAADLYMWLGDGGARDYRPFQGRRVFIFEPATGRRVEVGKVSFWKPAGKDAGDWDYTRSDVWNIDFTGFHAPGTFRLVVEGVGCSEDFVIQRTPRKIPYDVATQGYFFMRIGQPRVDRIAPIPRHPLYLPGENPPDTKVFLTSMSPLHPEWKKFSKGDPWDNAADWDRFKLPGNPTNPRARGGYSDAADWDRHLAHVSDIYDLLLPYLLSGGRLDDDDTGIAESGNGVPDAIDSARYGVDFFLSLRTEHGYGHGLTNPTKENVLYQGAPTALAAWANAANAAMLADACRIARNEPLMRRYREAAETAYKFASRLREPMLDESQDIGWMRPRGRDFRQTAAAFLYNVTGDQRYEQALEADSVVRASAEADLSADTHEQLYASVGYLITPRQVRFPRLQANIRTAILREARTHEAGLSAQRPSRRSAASPPCWFQSAQHCQRTIVAHFAATSEADREFFRDALILEADWSLGRNPANLIQMTTASTKLADKRSVRLCYTTGQFDGVPGLHPGHTPYMNMADWWPGMVMARPMWLAAQGYPEWSRWPHGEAHFDTRHVFANGEFTPRQTMRGKYALYAWLHVIEKSRTPAAAPRS